MSKELNYTNCKYLEQNDFIKFCKGNSVKVSPSDLELFERNELLYPIKRWVCPEEFAICKQQFGYIPDDIQKFNLNYLPLQELEEDIFKFLSLIHMDKINHPFDEMGANWQVYLTSPLDNKFTDWNDYKVNYTYAGESWKTTRIKNYYSYWQIYEIDGINQFRTGLYDIRFDGKENNYYLTCNKELVEKWTKNLKRNILNISSSGHCYNLS